MQLSQKQKKIFSIFFFLDFVNLDSVLNIFQKRMTLIADVFLKFRLRKTWLDKCVKSPVSEDPSTSNMVNGLKDCSKLNDSTFTIFIDTCAANSGLKSLSEWYAKAQDCLLTHSLPIKSIVLLRNWKIIRPHHDYCDILYDNPANETLINLIEKGQ